jgi:serine/threonine-protein kinase
MMDVGSVLNDRYRVVRLLGAGGMARVYEVENLKVPSRAAMKVLNRSLEGAEELLRRFRREAEIQAKLSHPNLVRVFDWDVTADQHPYLIMELLPGEDLARRLHREGALPLPVAMSIFTQTAAALQHAHLHGIIHRDLKPGNIFLWSESVIPNHVKVLDFGIAKITGQVGQVETQDAGVLGTPGYMAPEQVRGNTLAIGPKSDQWALALVLYEMLSGRPAFYRRGDEFFQTCQRILTDDPEPLPDPAMHRAIMRALAKEPGLRYPGLSEFVAAVQECVPPALYLPVLPAQTARLPEASVRGSTQGAASAISPPSTAGQSLQAAVGQASHHGAPGPVGQGDAPIGKLRRPHRLGSYALMAAVLLGSLGLLYRSRARWSSEPPLAPVAQQVTAAQGPSRPQAPPPPQAPSVGNPVGGVQPDLVHAAKAETLPALPSPEPTQPQGTSPRQETGPVAATPSAGLHPEHTAAPPVHRAAQQQPVFLWKLHVLKGADQKSELAAHLRTCLRGAGLLDVRDPPWQKHGQWRFELLNQDEILTLDPAIKVPGSVRQRANACLAAISRELAMVPDQVLLTVRRD